MAQSKSLTGQFCRMNGRGFVWPAVEARLVPNLLTDLAGFPVRSLALVGVLYLLSRWPRLRPALGSHGGLAFLLLWGGMGWLAPFLTRCSAYLPFFAGRLAGGPAGMAVGFITTLGLLLAGHSPLTLLCQPLAGWLGGRCRQARPATLWLVAGAVSLVGMDSPEAPGQWLIGTALPHLPPLLYLWLGFSLGAALFWSALDFLVQEPERERARVADRVLALVGKFEEILDQGLTPAAAQLLAPLLRQTLDVPALVLEQENRLLAESGDWNRAESVVEVELPEGARLKMAGGDPSREHLARGLGALLSTRLQQRALERARFDFLQAQIQPHFLFNTLNSLAAMCVQEPQRCRHLVLQLAQFLRHSLKKGRNLVPLTEELEIVRLYLEIEQVRFGDRLRVHWNLPDPLPLCQLPAFTLQPLVENAVRHGISPQVEGGNLWVRVFTNVPTVTIEVEDDGAGLENESDQAGSGIGLASVRQRLDRRLRLESSETGTKVTVEVDLAHLAG